MAAAEEQPQARTDDVPAVRPYRSTSSRLPAPHDPLMTHSPLLAMSFSTAISVPCLYTAFPTAALASAASSVAHRAAKTIVVRSDDIHGAACAAMPELERSARSTRAPRVKRQREVPMSADVSSPARLLAQALTEAWGQLDRASSVTGRTL